MRPLFYFAASLVAFHFLFWHETLGINLFLFGTGILAYSFAHRIEKKLSAEQIVLLFLTITSGLAVSIINSLFSKFMFILSLVVTHASLQTPARSVFEHFFNGLLNVFSFKQGIIPDFSLNPAHKKFKGVMYLRIGVIPLLIFILYFMLFSAGNSIFGDLTEGFLKDLGRMLNNMFSGTYVLFIMLGIILIRWQVRTHWARIARLSENLTLLRKQKKARLNTLTSGLRYEYLTALVLLVLLNALFAVTNFIDVKHVWFQFDVNEVHSLKEFLHEGVGWLIFTILISIGIILYYFRGNLNFYPKNEWLKKLGYLWIIQNGILGISVMLRTFYYMQYHGLASKRIGVLIFLSIVLFGLASLFYKISRARNTTYLLKVNSFFILAALVVSSLFPWNVIIAKANLNHRYPHQIHVDNYLDLDPQVFPILYANLDKIENQILRHQRNNVRWIRYKNLDDFKRDLGSKSRAYLNEKARVGIASWSLADHNTIKQLQEIMDEN